MDNYYVALLGYGTVGSGVAEVIAKNKNLIAERTNKIVTIKYIFVRPNKIVPKKVDDLVIYEEVTSDFDRIILDDDIKIVIECLGGTDAAYHYTREALIAGKHVVTSNKELVATKGTELIKLAADKGVRYLFDASVLGAIPAVRNLRQTLVANKITKINGIVNGTTNYILSEMSLSGKTYDEVLKNAQVLGYAEKDPSNDVSGRDATRKLCILASTAYGVEISEDMISTEGIEDISEADIKFADKYGYKIKLIASCEMSDDNYFKAHVSPRLVKKTNMFANIEGANNIVTFGCDMADDISLIGKGAGKLTTASAVVADVLNILTLLPLELPLEWSKERTFTKVDAGSYESKYLVRFDFGDGNVVREVLNKMLQITNMEFVDYSYENSFKVTYEFDKITYSDFICKLKQIRKEYPLVTEINCLEIFED